MESKSASKRLAATSVAAAGAQRPGTRLLTSSRTVIVSVAQFVPAVGR